MLTQALAWLRPKPLPSPYLGCFSCDGQAQRWAQSALPLLPSLSSLRLIPTLKIYSCDSDRCPSGNRMVWAILTSSSRSVPTKMRWTVTGFAGGAGRGKGCQSRWVDWLKPESKAGVRGDLVGQQKLEASWSHHSLVPTSWHLSLLLCPAFSSNVHSQVPARACEQVEWA